MISAGVKQERSKAKKGESHGDHDGKAHEDIVKKKWVQWEKERRAGGLHRANSFKKNDDKSFSVSKAIGMNAPQLTIQNSNRNSIQPIGTPKDFSSSPKRYSAAIFGSSPVTLTQRQAPKKQTADTAPSLRASLGLSFSEMFVSKNK